MCSKQCESVYEWVLVAKEEFNVWKECISTYIQGQTPVFPQIFRFYSFLPQDKNNLLGEIRIFVLTCFIVFKINLRTEWFPMQHWTYGFTYYCEERDFIPETELLHGGEEWMCHLGGIRNVVRSFCCPYHCTLSAWQFEFICHHYLLWNRKLSFPLRWQTCWLKWFRQDDIRNL